MDFTGITPVQGLGSTMPVCLVILLHACTKTLIVFVYILGDQGCGDTTVIGLLELPAEVLIDT